MAATMPCKLQTTKCSHRHREIDSGSNKIKKSKHACIVEARESARKRLERFLPKDHEDHLAEKAFNSWSHYNLVHKLIPMSQATKNPDREAAVDKEWGKLEKRRSSKRHRNSDKHSPFCFAYGHRSSQEC